MKKYISYLFTFFLSFIIINNVYAITRTEDNLHVNKKFTINENNIDNVLSVPYVDASEKVYDLTNKNVLSSDEIESIKTLISDFTNKTNMDVVILLTNLNYTDSELDEYATDFYDYNDFGLNFENYSGVLLAINLNSNNRYYNDHSFGNAQLYYHNRLDEMLDFIYSNMKANNYYMAIENFIYNLDYYYNEGVENGSAYIDPDTFELKYKFVSNGVESTTRTKDNLYVNKNFNITDENLYDVLNTPYVDASEKIYDYTGNNILNSGEIEKLKDRINEFTNKTNMDVAILLTNFSYSDSRLKNFAVDFYNYNDFGIDFDTYSGVLLIINLNSYNRYYNDHSFGNAQLYYHDRLDTILDDIYYDIYHGEYYDAIMQFIDELYSYYDEGIENNKTYIDPETFELKYKFDPNFLAISIISFTVTLVTILIMIKKNKMIKRKTNASDYLDKSSINIRRSDDIFVDSHTTAIHINTDSSSHGGGSSSSHGGSSMGSSGSFHSSGGGRHF